MPRETWIDSRSPSCDTFIQQTITTTTTTTTSSSSSSRRRLPSAPEVRLRRLFSAAPTAYAATVRPLSAPAMCSDSIIVPGDPGSVDMSNGKPPCYCHHQNENEQHMQQQFQFSCKLNFEDMNYNYNYIENEYYLPTRIVPRFSSIPRTMSMVANRSRSTSSSDDNEEECHSLADSLEDLSRINSRLSFDDKPVRGAPTPALTNNNPVKEPVPKAEKFFVGLKEQEENFGLELPAFLKEKLEKRRQELDQKKPMKLLEPLQTHRSKTPFKQSKTRRVALNRFRQFESIPEENSDTNNRIRIARNRVLARNFQPRFQMGHTQRALQGIVQDSKDLSIISPNFEGKDSVQTVVPLPVNANNKGKQTELAAGNPGWGNFYVIKGADDAAPRDKENSNNGDVPRVKTARKKWTKIETSSCEERVTTTVRMQNPSNAQHQIRQQRAATSVTKAYVTLPRLSNGGRASAGSEKPKPVIPVKMQRHTPVPAIKAKTDRLSPEPSSLPSLSSPTKVQALNSKTFTRPKNISKSARSSPQDSPVKSKMVVTKQSNGAAGKPDIEPGTIVAEAGPSEPGTWSVILSGLYPQPEMELRLVFPPTEDEASPKNGKDSPKGGGSPNKKPSDRGSPTKKLNDGGSPNKKTTSEKRVQSPLNETNSADYILTFKNNNNLPIKRPSSAGSIKNKSRPSSAEASPSKSKALVPATKSLVPRSPIRKSPVPKSPEMPIVANSPDSMLMWPEMQSLLQEQMTRHVKKQVTTVTTSTTTTEGAIMVQRLRGGKGAKEDATTFSSALQPVEVNNMAMTTQRRKRASS